MFERIKRWHQKRRDLRLIKYSMQILRSIYPELDVTTRAVLVKTVWDFVADYGENYNQPELAQFYFDEINHIVTVMNKRLSV
ncbi:MAG: hypothetical protein J6R90_06055 [Alistipes sp.]|nr:hypothetical protein [Alistipes sp.]